MSKAVHDELQDVRVSHIERVSASGEIEVVAGFVIDKSVVRMVVDTAHREGWSEMIAFRGVVVDHVQDDFDTCGVECLDRFSELICRTCPDLCPVLVVGAEISDRVVTPVVLATLLDEVMVMNELMDRHQFDRSNSELYEMFNDRRMTQGGVGAPFLWRDVGVLHREPSDMGLVDDALVGWGFE